MEVTNERENVLLMQGITLNNGDHVNCTWCLGARWLCTKPETRASVDKLHTGRHDVLYEGLNTCSQC